MKYIEAIAQHFYEVNHGNNWTDANVKDALKDVNFEMATTKINGANTIALLLFHMNFYNMVVYDRLVGIKRHFEHEESLQNEIASGEEWQQLQQTYFDNVERIHKAILAFDEALLFEQKTRNTPYKNLHGLIEHIHYHLGQINILKKIMASQ